MSPLILLALYVAFRLKHFSCDFLLQTDWMALTKGRPGREGYRALFSHTLIHALGTLLIVLVFAPALWWLAPVDFAVHSLTDRIKGKLTFERNWQPSDKIFWWSFGIDQEVHNFTHMIYIVIIVIHLGGIAV